MGELTLYTVLPAAETGGGPAVAFENIGQLTVGVSRASPAKAALTSEAGISARGLAR